ncbi:hypothetical protein [Leptobacterium sp. I13]|uniref:hypothetical protein n=1 Tax=Leptobacterium meishanense TaxID=3128904 RepID=UPI0030EBBB05
MYKLYAKNRCEKQYKNPLLTASHSTNDNSVVATGAMVTKNVLRNKIIAGVSAKVVKKLD